ncbi:M3 family metallopeptidase [Wenzhouxiangella sp. C33]|uniref:M3 family metallopeptidase n=2 Tax=Wenzhouxiangella limi TaxID=2707351 RepID=A0A845UYF0_9GAMM|nr:M3 family metallopeptidase [Wenzhouxiangella limi]
MPEAPTAPMGTEAEPEDVIPEPEEINPLLADSDLPYGLPPFDQIRNEHFLPAFEQGMDEQIQEIEAIADNSEPPTFDNTIVALERAGQTLAGVQRVFGNLSGAHTNPDLQAVQREVSPRLAAHRDAILLNPNLFARIETLYEDRDSLELDAESLRLLEHVYRQFVRAGARLDEDGKARLREINSELAALGTEFSQKVLAEVNDSAVVYDDVDMLAGLSDSRIESAASEAVEREQGEGNYVITLLNTSGQPPLASMDNRAARERLHTASLDRGSRGNEHDTTATVSQILALRAERARMLGYDTHADYVLEEQTAGSVETVNELHERVGPIAVANARREGEALQALIDEAAEESGEEPFELASWDWAYYTEKLRQQRFDFDDAEVRPYFEMRNVLVNGVFYSAEKLFGITFVEREDLPSYHPDTTVWEVFDADGEGMGLFITDFYARSSKRGGAWMNSYRVHSGLLGGYPVVGNHLNVPKPPEGEPTLLTWDEVVTMFHEFGHAVHGLFSDVRFPTFAATSVPRDFVEYPSQVYEMWADWPEVLANYAIHYETGEPIPQELLDRVMEAALFNEGFRTTEYLAASVLDMAMHQLGPDEVPGPDEVMAFEAEVLAAAGMDYDPVPPRYRTPYFSHSMGGYSAGYYSYFWAEVLDADSVLWIRENGGLDRETGQRLRDTVLSKGGSKEAMELYQDFAGRVPGIEPLLERRGLIED